MLSGSRSQQQVVFGLILKVPEPIGRSRALQAWVSLCGAGNLGHWQMGWRIAFGVSRDLGEFMVVILREFYPPYPPLVI